MNRQSKCDILTSNDTCGEMAKHDRMLDLCLRLMSGEIISKSEEAMKNNVSERTIQRDLDDLRAFFDEKSQRTGENRSLCYDHHQRGYRIMQENQNAYSDGETLAVSKVLLESRAFTREEITDILTKLMKNCVPRQNADRVKALISNELHYYLPTQNSSPSMDKIWQIGVAINETRFLEIQYTRQNGDLSQKEIEPVAIMFSEFYFYLLAYDRSVTEKKDFNEKKYKSPTIYRIDRINGMKLLDEHFRIPYKNRFEESEFRKRVQFMYGGELKKVHFTYTGPSIDAVLDRLPTARIESEENGKYRISAEVFGDGIDMWLRSQGDWVS